MRRSRMILAIAPLALVGCEANVQVHRTPPLGWGPVVTCPAVAGHLTCPPARAIVPEAPELAPVPTPAPQADRPPSAQVELEIDVRDVPAPKAPERPSSAPPPLTPAAPLEPTSGWVPVPRLTPRPHA